METQEHLESLRALQRRHPEGGGTPVTWDDFRLVIDLLEVLMADASQQDQDLAAVEADEQARDTTQASQQAATEQALQDLRDEVNNLTAQLPTPEAANAVHEKLAALDQAIKGGTAAETAEQATAQAADPGAQQQPPAPSGGEAQPAGGGGAQPTT